jgi:hypothetical protein
MSFESSLQEGLLGESIIVRWLNQQGCHVLPAYEIEQSQAKGPRLFTAKQQLISPDLLCWHGCEQFWIEAKTKSAFTWHRLSETWQTGIDRRHWHHYQQVQEIMGIPVWLLFLHKPGNLAKDTPTGMQSPYGLYGESLAKLKDSVHHEHGNCGSSGMVYWQLETLTKYANVMAFDNGRPMEIVESSKSSIP